MPDYQVMGVAPDRPAAEQVVGNLRLAGYRQQSISVIMVTRDEVDALEHVDDQGGEGAAEVATSAAKGGAVGLGVGLLGGAATLFIPDLQVLSPAILLALFGGTGAFVGTLSGAFASEDVSDQVIERYGMALREGQALIRVTMPDAERAKLAEERLSAAGATNVMSFMQDETAVTDEPGITDVSKQ